MKNTVRQRMMAVWCLWGIVAIGLTFGHAGSVSGYQDEDANLTESETSPPDEPLDISAFKPVELTEPPDRKLTVIEQTEVRTQRPHVLTSTLLEKKYVAVIEFQMPDLTETQRYRIGAMHGVIRDIQSAFPVRDRRGIPFPYLQGGQSRLYLFHAYNAFLSHAYNAFGQGAGEQSPSSLRSYFEQLLEDVPDTRRPPESSLEFLFLPPEAGLYNVEGLGNSSSDRGATARIMLYVSSSQEAESVGNALLTLFDYGLTYDNQARLLAQWQRRWEQWESIPQNLAAAEATLAKHREDLAKLDAIPGNVIESIKQRRYNLDVDLQGVEARNDAISEAMKNEDPRTTIIRSRLFELQVEAQIDLRGLLAQRDKLNEMIETFDSSERLKTIVQRAASGLRNVQSRVKALPLELELFHIASEFIQPLEVTNNEIRLYPVQWGDEPPRGR